MTELQEKSKAYATTNNGRNLIILEYLHKSCELAGDKAQGAARTLEITIMLRSQNFIHLGNHCRLKPGHFFYFVR